METQLQSMALELPPVAAHPNRKQFRGVLTFVDAPSDKPPSGAKGHRVLLTKDAAEQALPSLLGMALDVAPSLDRHDARCKIGVITSAEVVPSEVIPGGQFATRRTAGDRVDRGTTSAHEIQISGYLFARDFPEVVREMRSSGRQVLGMSYEIADASIADMNAPVWMITRCTFTGAALLRRDKAAYRDTWIELVN
jgi:hypothetical protein